MAIFLNRPLTKLDFGWHIGNSAPVDKSLAYQQKLLTDLLKQVSRSFYLTLRILPSSIRPQIGLAYLLARTTDTIADTEVVPQEERLHLLQQLRTRILGHGNSPLDFSALAQKQDLYAERILLENWSTTLELLKTFSLADQQFIREVLNKIISGQELDLYRFGTDSKSYIRALDSDKELDDYTYRVAGCVGEYWTKMCRAHVFPNLRADDVFLLKNGVRFGKGLQLVNILRDLPADLRTGRCYLPATPLKARGLVPEDLLRPENEPKLRSHYNYYLDLAESHLAAGWAYTNAIPRRCVRIRLACAWPILIGLKTIAELRTANVLDPDQRIKISRGEVRKIIIKSVLYYPFPKAWQNLADSISPDGVLSDEKSS